jgi:hypothetical protein
MWGRRDPSCEASSFSLQISGCPKCADADPRMRRIRASAVLAASQVGGKLFAPLRAGNQLVRGAVLGDPHFIPKWTACGWERRSPPWTARASPRSRRRGSSPSARGRAGARPSRALTGLGRRDIPTSIAGPDRGSMPRPRRTPACSHSARPSAACMPSPCTNSCSANSPSRSSRSISSVTSGPTVTPCSATTSRSPDSSGRKKPARQMRSCFGWRGKILWRHRPAG